MCSCNDSPDLGQNDYSLQTANVGIQTITNANSSLAGVGSLPVFTATSGFKGSIIKSVRIKAVNPVTTGMVRLFLYDGSTYSLYKEIPIPVAPVLAATPTPAPALPTFELTLDGDLKLAPTYALTASTQNSQEFGIIVEGLDWKYPLTLPSVCCNFIQKAASTGIATLASVVGVTVIYNAPGSTNGSFIKSITIKALQPTSINGMINLYISPDGTDWTLMQQILVPEADQSGYQPSWKTVVNLNMNINSGYYLGASSLLAESFAVTIEAIDWTYPIS